jgi:hypothetical protein
MNEFTGTLDRGQAFTLEGIIGTVIILTAVLFALESVIITPTTGGTVDPQIRDRLEVQSSDVLSTVGQNQSFDLNAYARYWNPDQRTFDGGINPGIGYGTNPPPGQLGDLLEQTFTARGQQYNVVLRYRPKNLSEGAGSVTMVSQGQPSDSAVTSTYTVTLYDNQTLSAPNASNVELWRYSPDVEDTDAPYYPIPNAVDGPVYNVVEVRLTVW